MEIGKNIKEYRELRGLKQKELSNLLNIPASTLANYEIGRREPSIDTLKRISKALDVHIINLLGLEKKHKSIAKLTVDTKVDMTELETAKAKLDQIKVLINEVNNMEINLKVKTDVGR